MESVIPFTCIHVNMAKHTTDACSNVLQHVHLLYVCARLQHVPIYHMIYLSTKTELGRSASRNEMHFFSK